MSGYRISQAAELAGFSPSALRFYEKEGLLPAPARSATGYRSYDDAAVSRLHFVHRARELGLGLDAIRDLILVWDAGACAPVQHGFAERIAAHRQAVAARLVELTALHDELVTAEQTVSAAESDLACGPGCACLATPHPKGLASPPPRRVADVTFSLRPPAPDATAVACTLTSSDMQQRMQDWADLVSTAATHETLADGAQLEFPSSPALAARIAELCALEQACCPFFTFALTLTADRITVRVSAPGEAGELVAALLAGAA